MGAALPRGFREGHCGELACPHRDVSCCDACAEQHEEIVDVCGQHFWVDNPLDRAALADALKKDDRTEMLRRLSWTDLPLDGLSDEQLLATYQYVERELARRHHCHVPGVALVKKERRLGRTNRLGTRFVAYVGASADEAAEVAVCTTRTAARRMAKKHHAVFFADFAKKKIGAAHA